jgi:molybdenum cofactor cytidylyltransferase
VLAAGASTRMGVPKLLLPLGDEPIVRRTVRQVCDAGVADEVIVVSGDEHERLVAALEGLPVRHAVNPDYLTGMGSSFRTAVEHLGDSRAALFALADQPFLLPEHYRSLVDAYRLHAPLIVGSRFGDVTAPPHVFDRALYPELAVLEHGARSVLQRHAGRMVVMHFAAELLMDIDTPEDYERAKLRIAAGR